MLVELNEDKDTIIKKIREVVKQLEPDVLVLEKDENNDLVVESMKDEFKKEWTKLVIGVIPLILALSTEFANWLKMTLFFVSYIIIGKDVLKKAVNNISKGQIFDENFLMGIATLGAFAIGEYPEGIAVLLFYQVGELFQDMAVHRSRKSIAELMDIRPDFANLNRGDEVIKVSPTEVEPGDIIIIRPGEKVPLDGVIVQGESSMDTSALTGESAPRNVKVGDEVLGGFINNNGLLSVKVSKPFSQSTVSKY